MQNENPVTKESIIENTYLLKISPIPSFPKRGNSSLWQSLPAGRQGR
jgi:hypothetical protein